MEYSCLINSSQGLAVLNCSGAVEFAELNNGLGLLSWHPEFMGVKKVLTDLAQGPSLQPSNAEIKSCARITALALEKNPLQIAIVAQDDLTFGLLRMFAAYVEDEKVNVFRTKQEACGWLQVQFQVG